MWAPTGPLPKGEGESLGENVVNDLTGNIGEAVVAALEEKREPFVVEAQEVHDRGLQVVNTDFVFHDPEAELIGRAKIEAWFDAAAGEPHCEAVGVVVAAEDTACCRATFAERRASELAAA